MVKGRSSRVRMRRRSRVRRLLLVALVGGLVACASGGQQSLRDGRLRPGIGQKAVLTEWGPPERTLSVVSEEQLRARWGGPPTASLFRDGRPLDLWLYEKSGVELVFDNGDLAAWKTDRSAEQLRALPQPRASANPFPAGSGRESLDLGLLRVDIGQQAFRAKWGQPDRMVPIASDQELDARWGPETRASVLAGKRPLEIWGYDKDGVELLFHKGDLAAWKTQKTVAELRAILTRR